jgi:magnesium chelatase family protein
MHVEVSRVPYAELAGPPGEPSVAVAGRVLEARERQVERQPRAGARTNGELTTRGLRAVAAADRGGRRLLATAVDRLGLTARAYDRVLRVARTIADLESYGQLAEHHVAEALHFRSPIQRFG